MDRCSLRRFSQTVFFLLLLSCCFIVFDAVAFLQRPLNAGQQSLTFVFHPGSHVRTLARSLEQLQCLRHWRDRYYIRWYARILQADQHLFAGEYSIEPGLTFPQLFEKIGRGKVLLHPITFVNGWTFQQLRAALNNESHLLHQTRNFSDAAIMKALNHPHQHPEGRFLPETYYFERNATDLSILQRAYAGMEKNLEALWKTRDQHLPYKTSSDALIAASLIEKETALPEEAPRVAGVLVRRLKKKMYLQFDPSVIYGMGEKFKGNITRADLRRKTPYNTYRVKGLPPTPIAMPGTVALEAAVHPDQSNALYFVATGQGGHHFSATLKEHRRAVRRLIQFQKNNATR